MATQIKFYGAWDAPPDEMYQNVRRHIRNDFLELPIGTILTEAEPQQYIVGQRMYLFLKATFDIPETESLLRRIRAPR